MLLGEIQYIEKKIGELEKENPVSHIIPVLAFPIAENIELDVLKILELDCMAMSICTYIYSDIMEWLFLLFPFMKKEERHKYRHSICYIKNSI